jgi:hypothetical protein
LEVEMLSNLDVVLQVLQSPTVLVYNKKNEYEKVFADLTEKRHLEREVDVIRVCVAHVGNVSEEVELRTIASQCVVVVAKFGALSQISMTRIYKCALGTIKEALGQQGNLKEHPARGAYANMLVPLGLRCDAYPSLGTDVLFDVVSLLRRRQTEAPLWFGASCSC